MEIFVEIIVLIIASAIGSSIVLYFGVFDKISPRSAKWKYSLLMQLLYTAIVTIALTLLNFLSISVSWGLLLAIALMMWFFSAWLAVSVARSNGNCPASPADQKKI
jgi:predicted neutral ceramidase superfamily lipid hydrolase